MRTLLLGLDGLDPDLVEEYELDNIQSIGEGFEIKTHGNSGPSWASVLTGLTPDEHGVRKLEPQQTSQSWEGTPIWEKVDGYSGIANVPLTYPPTQLKGWMVTSLMTPKKAIYTYPRNLYKDLDDLDYKVDVWIDEHKNHPNGHYGTIPFEFTQEYKKGLLDRLTTVMRTRSNAFIYLINNEPADFMFLCYTSLDRIQHLVFDDEPTLRYFYNLLDIQVEKILDAIDDDVEIFITSDHGFREIDMPDTDIKGEHREEGYGNVNVPNNKFSNLQQLHNNVVDSANRNNIENKLEDLGYI